MESLCKLSIFFQFLSFAKIYCKEHQNLRFYARFFGFTDDELAMLILEVSETDFSEWIEIMQQKEEPEKTKPQRNNALRDKSLRVVV